MNVAGSAEKVSAGHRSPLQALATLSAVALPLYALDQLSKWWIVKNFAPLEQRVVIEDFFDLCYFMNTGAAFSIGTGNNWFFIVISIAALAGLLFFHARGAFSDALSRWGSALVMAGILGNLTDRLVHGHVVDFLLFDLHVRYANPWPAFNVADSCICIAVGLFLIASFREGKRTDPTT
jgi:signal peptidase II